MEAETDPAEYFFKNPKYHDCYLTVGDPETNYVEKIGVSVRHLAAHSSVFKEMLVDSDLADPRGKNTHITDISPDVFKLMLRHVYGGKLPAMSRDVAAELLMCADKYNIKNLVALSCWHLNPQSVDEVFPALKCVAYITVPSLESVVRKIVQKYTNLIVNHTEFVNMDENSLEYITKQDKLAITEIELWKALVKWGLGQESETSLLRKILKKPLKHVRLLTLTQDEFLNEVLPKNVLTSEETVNVLKAIGNNEHFIDPGLCASKIKRKIHQEKLTMAQATAPKALLRKVARNFVQSFPCEYYSYYQSCQKYYPHGNEFQKNSQFFLKVGSHKIDVVSFSCITKPNSQPQVQTTYNFICEITVRELVNNAVCIDELQYIRYEGFVVYNTTIDIPLELKGENLILKPRTTYSFELNFSVPHPVHRTKCIDNQRQLDTTFIDRGYPNCSGFHMKVKHTSPIHVININYNQIFKNSKPNSTPRP